VIPQDDHPLARTNEITIQIKNGKFHVCVSYRKVVPTRIEPAPASIVALDPGCRKFLSFFDTDGEAGVIGQGVYHHFKPHLVTMANCQRKIRSAKKAWRSRDRKESHTKREAKRAKRLYRCRILRFSKRYRKHLRRVQNICKDAHYKTAHWLLTNYTHVILPKFNVSFFAKKRSGLSRTTRKAMLQLRHYMFRQRLIQKSTEYPGRQVYCGGEAYTSKTCTSCGTLNENLGSSELFACSNCPHVCDRDINAARNILLLYCKAKANQGKTKKK
jgi:putative transposase